MNCASGAPAAPSALKPIPSPSSSLRDDPRPPLLRPRHRPRPGRFAARPLSRSLPYRGNPRLTPEQRLRYLDVSQGQYYVKEFLTRPIKFTEQDLNSDRFGSGFDLIVCRNVIIYFTNAAKAKLYQNSRRPSAPAACFSWAAQNHPQSQRDRVEKHPDLVLCERVRL